MPTSCLTLFLLAATLVACAPLPSGRVADAPSPEARRKLEPAAGRVLHGAGQSREAFARYVETVGPGKPVLHMSYVGLREPERVTAFFARLSADLARYEPHHLIPQIGVSMTAEGSRPNRYEHRVAAGELDASLDALVDGLRALGRPAFLRLGYEFNGQWNGYVPDAYKEAWRRVAGALRAAGLAEVALVWCWTPDGRDREFMSFYPGDEWVDWWAVDIFNRVHFDDGHVEAFMREARRRRFPVMLGETTPRKVGVLEGERSWDLWFRPFTAFVRRHPHLKAISYISEDWARYPRWKDWGDARPWREPTVLRRWTEELADPRYVHAAEMAAVRAALGLPPIETR